MPIYLKVRMSNAPVTGYLIAGVLSLIVFLIPVFLFLLRRWKVMPQLVRILWVNVLLIPFYFALYILGRMVVQGNSVSAWSLVAMTLQVYAMEIFWPIAFGRFPIIGLVWIMSIAFAYIITKSRSKTGRVIGTRTSDAK
jgi:hypothetical protein